MNDLFLLLFVVFFIWILVQACRQTSKIGIRAIYTYVFVCVLLGLCIIVTEGGITQLKPIKYVGVTFRPGYQLLASKHPVETFGSKVNQK